MKNIFLFGAGASHGSGGVNIIPPLGRELFIKLRDVFPQTWGSLPLSLHNLFDKNFEFGMEEVWKKYSQNIPALMQDMASYFSQFNVTDPNINLYSKIINEIKRKKLLGSTLISTVNYDCLIEGAASKNGLAIAYFDKPNNTNLALIKLHGSCNFIPKNMSATRGVSYTAGVTFDAGIEPVQPNKVASFCRSNTVLYPAMAIYTKDKPLQIASTTITNLQKYWQKETKHADKIFTIGIYPNLEDKHIWSFISQTEGEIFYCGNESGFNKWQKQTKRNDCYITKNFGNSISTILSKL